MTYRGKSDSRAYSIEESRRLHLVHCSGCGDCKKWRDRPHLETVDEWLARMRSVNLSPAATPTRKQGG